MVLDLSNPVVQDFVFKVFDDIMSGRLGMEIQPRSLSCSGIIPAKQLDTNEIGDGH